MNGGCVEENQAKLTNKEINAQALSCTNCLCILQLGSSPNSFPCPILSERYAYTWFKELR